MKEGIVYVFRVAGGRIYKVGRTSISADERMRTLRQSAGVDLEFVDAVKVSDAVSAERLLHHSLTVWRHHGHEWYELDDASLEVFLGGMHELGERIGPEEEVGPRNAQFTYVQQIRLSPQQVEKIDAYAQCLEAQTPGSRVSRAEAVRILLLAGLEAKSVKP